MTYLLKGSLLAAILARALRWILSRTYHHSLVHHDGSLGEFSN